jgi:hypothetical protein
MATSVMTADTPMIMPSMVRPVRILLRPSALNAMRKVITGDIVVFDRRFGDLAIYLSIQS